MPAAKWKWFREQLARGYMTAFDPRTAVPCHWSLAPEDTAGLIFWTKDPWYLIEDMELLRRYKIVVHMTLTGWTEVEKGAPSMEDGIKLMARTAKVFGPENVVWRFSPVPMVSDALTRFEWIAKRASEFGLQEVYAAFLQENDFLPESRPPRVRAELLRLMAAHSHGLKIRLCQEDITSLGSALVLPENLGRGVCEDGHRFFGRMWVPSEGCGCVLAVDPFTINESCTMGCQYCYAADETLADRKRNTTKHHLPVAR